jgi:ubiquinone/menaquinone biosynthesis C-methylase UbiE
MEASAPMTEPDTLRDSFNAVADLYDEVRPGYPEHIIEAAISLAQLPPGAKILEIGCGSGQITIPFATRGYEIVALEPGPALAALAAEKCRSYTRVEVVAQTFESWAVREAMFDLVLSAQAFHWIAPECGLTKAAIALKSGGGIALIWNFDVSEDTAFWQATQPVYVTHFPKSGPGDTRPSLTEKAKSCARALNGSDAFRNLREIRYSWEKTYRGEDYLKLLETHSDHRALPEPERAQFFEAIAQLIEQCGGSVQRKYETLLLVARRR